MNLFIGNLNPETTVASLRPLFEEFGEIVSIKIIYDNATGTSRGFGFVEYTDRFHAFDAIDNIDATYFEGNVISVKEAKQNNTKGGSGGKKPFNKSRGPRPGGYNNNREGGGFNRDNNRPSGGYNRDNSSRSSGGYNRDNSRSSGGYNKDYNSKKANDTNNNWNSTNQNSNDQVNNNY